MNKQLELVDATNGSADHVEGRNAASEEERFGDGSQSDWFEPGSSWRPISLTDALARSDDAPPSLLQRVDGVGLLYPGRTHWFIGEPESCKTWAAVLAAAEVLVEGGRVLWIDYEDTARALVARLRSVGLDDDCIRRIDYLNPREPLSYPDGEPAPGAFEFSRLVTFGDYDFAVIDSVNESMSVEGLNSNDADSTARWMRLLPNRLAGAGAAVAALDHVTKSAEGRGRYATGSQHKLAGVTGVAYVFEIRSRLSRSAGEPVRGEVNLRISKDRPGHVRATAVHDIAATLVLTAFPDGSVVGTFEAPRPRGAASRDLRRELATYLGQNPGSSKQAIEDSVIGKGSAIRDVLEAMTTEGLVRVDTSGRAHRVFLTEEGADLLSVA